MRAAPRTRPAIITEERRQLVNGRHGQNRCIPPLVLKSKTYGTPGAICGLKPPATCAVTDLQNTSAVTDCRCTDLKRRISTESEYSPPPASTSLPAARSSP